MDSVEVVNKMACCDLTRYTTIDVTWKMENYTTLKTANCQTNITETIKMFLELRPNQNFYSGSEYYYGSSYYCVNPYVKYQCRKSDPKKHIKIQINTTRGAANIFRDFSHLNREFSAVNPLTNFMTQCNLTKYMEKSSLVLKIKIIIKEAFDNFSIGNDLLNSKGKILKDIHSLMLNEELSDFKFIVDGKDFHVHKALLAARSPVFLKMFTSNFQESKSNEGTIKDISKEAFKEFINFLYAETIENIDQHVLELLAIADLYQVDDLKTICKAQLQTGLTEENAAFVFQYAHRYRCDDDLKEAAFKLIKGVFQKNNIDIPNEFLCAPYALQSAVETMNKMMDILRPEVAIREFKKELKKN